MVIRPFSVGLIGNVVVDEVEELVLEVEVVVFVEVDWEVEVLVVEVELLVELEVELVEAEVLVD